MFSGMRTRACATAVAAVFAGAVAALALAGGTAWADSVVEFDYGLADFNFWYEGQTYRTDIFDNLKDVMPGDVRHECIEIRNADSSGHDAKIYFTVKGIGEDDYAFFSQMELKLEQEGVSEPLYEGSCAEQAMMPDGIYLGTFSPGESTHFDVTLTASPDMGNAYQGASGTSYGVFTAEVIDADDSAAQPSDGGGVASGVASAIAKTGDVAGGILFVATLVILASSVILVVVIRRRS